MASRHLHPPSPPLHFFFEHLSPYMYDLAHRPNMAVGPKISNTTPKEETCCRHGRLRMPWEGHRARQCWRQSPQDVLQWKPAVDPCTDELGAGISRLKMQERERASPAQTPIDPNEDYEDLDEICKDM